MQEKDRIRNYKKEYYKENKERVRKGQKEWYKKNREDQIEKTKEYIKKTNYRYEKTPKQRRIRYIKRRTRLLYPLEGHNCEFCGNKANEHHHNSLPIEIDKFNFVCKRCHKLIHNQIIRREGEKNAKKRRRN